LPCRDMAHSFVNMGILKSLLILSPSARSASITHPDELFASGSSASSPQNMTLSQVAFGNGYAFTTRGFNGGIPGPTLRMNPGETFYITLYNNLQVSNDVPCSTTGSQYCETATTNLHTHGLHISSKGMEDGLAYYSDDIFARVEPGANTSYQFTIPENHMGGTHWYHPHVHHATALQAGGGAAGVFIVEDPAGYLPDEYSSMTEKVLFISGHNLVTLQSMAVDSQSTLMATAATDAQASSLDTNVFLVNGQIGPTMTISSHVWYRLRIVYAAVEQSLQLVVTGNATCQTQLLAKDGVYLMTIPREVTTIYLYPGARADIALSCTCQSYPCASILQSSTGTRRLQPRPPGGMGGGGAAPNQAGANAVSVDVMQIVVTETVGGSTTTLPSVSLQRPCYLVDLQSATVDTSNSGNLNLAGGARSVQWNGQGTSMTYQNVHAGGNTLSDWQALTNFTAGTIHEIVVQGADAHPLHLHVNPYQIISMPQASIGNGYFQVGDWHDTLLVEGGNSITVRMNVDTFTGKLVVHCHILEHEDEGMMAWINVAGTEGATYSGNTALDSTCYTTIPTTFIHASGVSSTAGPGTGQVSNAMHDASLRHATLAMLILPCLHYFS